MKKILIIVLFFELIIYSVIQGQTLTQQQKEKILLSLSDSSLNYRSAGLDAVIKYELIEAEDVLINNFWYESRTLQTKYLYALQKLNSSVTHQLALSLLDTLDSNPTGNAIVSSTIEEIKAEIASVLIDLGDYSKVQYVFELLNRDKPEVNSTAVYILPKIIQNIPEYEILAKDELLFAAINSDYEFLRFNSLVLFLNLYGEESLPLLIDAFKNDPDPSIRSAILNQFLPSNNLSVNSILKERMAVEISPIRRQIADVLLFKNGSLNDYEFVSYYLDQETDTTNRILIKNSLEVYLPIPLDSTFSIESLFDSLLSLIDQSQDLNWLGDLAFSNQLKNILTSAKTNLQNGDSLSCRVQVKAFQDLVDNVYKDSLNSDPRFLTIEGWKFLYWNAQYILDRLPEPPANPNLLVNLKNSLGNQIPASNVKYYEGSWKDAVNNGDGTFTVITIRPIVSIRVFYEYASQQIDNVPAQNNTYTFATVNATVQLKNSLGNLIDVGTVQYYAGAWRSFGTTSNGVAYKELLPINYSFRMTYEYGSIDKQQNLSSDPTVVFQTVNAAVQLKNSLGNLIDLGTVQYYAGAWRSFGTTSNGVVYKELLPVNYSFRMTYEYVSKDKQQNLSTNPVVDFSTVLCSVKVSKTSNNQPLNNAAVKYYSGSWRNLGTTNSDGITTKELLPANLSFRATLGNVSLDKQQDISVNNLVEILLNIP